MRILYKPIVIIYELFIKAMLTLYLRSTTIKLPLLSDHELMVIQ